MVKYDFFGACTFTLHTSLAQAREIKQGLPRYTLNNRVLFTYKD